MLISVAFWKSMHGNAMDSRTREHHFLRERVTFNSLKILKIPNWQKEYYWLKNNRAIIFAGHLPRIVFFVGSLVPDKLVKPRLYVSETIMSCKFLGRSHPESSRRDAYQNQWQVIWCWVLWNKCNIVKAKNSWCGRVAICGHPASSRKCHFRNCISCKEEFHLRIQKHTSVN